MLVYYELMILVASIVYIMNWSGFLYSFSKFVYKLLNPKKEYLGQNLPKPFSCSLCMSFWVVFIYSLFSFGFVYSLGLGCLGAIFSMVVDLVVGFIIKKINLLRYGKEN